MRNDKDANGSPFRAVRYVAPAATSRRTCRTSPACWEIPHESPKGEKAWRFIVKQTGADLQAAILRVDGDTGALTGRFEDGTFVISHFDGSRPSLMHVTPAADGTLKIVQQGSNRDGTLIAYRPDVARAKGLPEPSNYTTHTTVRDPNEMFTFSFPTSTARPVERGSQVQGQGGASRSSPAPGARTATTKRSISCRSTSSIATRVWRSSRSTSRSRSSRTNWPASRRSSPKYGVEYTYLIAGAPAEMWEKVPQAVNLNTWPATIFVGRDGRVKRIHAGFAAPASGEFNDQLKQHEFDRPNHRTPAGCRSRASTQQTTSDWRARNPRLDPPVACDRARSCCCRRIPAPMAGVCDRSARVAAIRHHSSDRGPGSVVFPGLFFVACVEARWRSGNAAVCKTAIEGSSPSRASISVRREPSTVYRAVARQG